MSQSFCFHRTGHDENKKLLRASTHYTMGVQGMPDSEEEIYSTMFSSLKHPARRKILRMLSEEAMTFSQLLEALGITSSHLTYHLENLGELLSKDDNGKYRLSTFGSASVETMKIVEEAPAVRSKHGFPLSLRCRSLLAGLLIAVILLTSMFYVEYASFNQLSSEHEELESKYDQLLTWSASTDDAITFLQDVIEVDTAQYQSTLLSNTVEVRSDLGGVVEEILKYSLANSESQIDVILRFRNGELSRYQMNVFEESPIYAEPQSFSVLDTAKSLLQRLISYNDASYLRDMSNMLTSVSKLEDTEITEGNMKLVISVSGANAEIQWLYKENGVDFPVKSLTLNFENGVLKDLTDGWYLFSIGSTEVNVSGEEALEIAKNAVQGFTWEADGTAVSNFNVLDEPVSVVFHPIPRGQNLKLIPYWYIILYLDKVYPGGVNRIAVGMWADAGTVDQIRTLSG
jgi:DNA-binding transcriptional ArsR family regulator